MQPISDREWHDLMPDRKVGLRYDDGKGFNGGLVVGTAFVLGLPRKDGLLVEIAEIFYQGDNNPAFTCHQVLNVVRKNLFESTTACAECVGGIVIAHAHSNKCEHCGGIGLEPVSESGKEKR